ncbi:hypothetical protein [Propylenella binzhouense]|nr:hypothetical protein [Propylenella binzhouense]
MVRVLYLAIVAGLIGAGAGAAGGLESRDSRFPTEAGLVLIYALQR